MHAFYALKAAQNYTKGGNRPMERKLNQIETKLWHIMATLQTKW